MSSWWLCWPLCWAGSSELAAYGYLLVQEGLRLPGCSTHTATLQQAPWWWCPEHLLQSDTLGAGDIRLVMQHGSP